MHPLVDAFYKGRTPLKRHKGAYFDNTSKPRKACAVGAIYYGLFKKAEENPLAVVPVILKDYPQFRGWTSVPCGCDDEGGTVAAILIHLNDEHTGHDWSDKKIADWLETALAGINA